MNAQLSIYIYNIPLQFLGWSDAARWLSPAKDASIGTELLQIEPDLLAPRVLILHVQVQDKAAQLFRCVLRPKRITKWVR